MENLKNKKSFLVALVILISITVFSLSAKASSEGNLVLIDNQKMEQLITGSEGSFIYIGRPTCPICEKFEPTLQETLKSLNKELYYYNTDEARKENETKMRELLAPLEITSVPTLIYIKDGVVIEKLNGLQTDEQLRDFFNSEK